MRVAVVALLRGFTSGHALLTRAWCDRSRFARGVLVTYILFVALYSYVGLHTFES